MTDIQPTTQSISDDQELAKVLAGVSQEADGAVQQQPDPSTDGQVQPDEQQEQFNQEQNQPDQGLPQPTQDSLANDYTAQATESDNELTPIKNEAIGELRPLVDKLSLPADEKFDTYLLLIRSTDDRSLVQPAYAAAKEITDESKRAQALLDIIKEIDYLSKPQQSQ